jgi:hypothetical protein
MNQKTSDWLDLVRQKVESLRFGMVQITIHDSKVTHIERTEKTRMEQPRPVASRPDLLEDE